MGNTVEQSLKTSPSDDVSLKRTMLAKLGRLKGSETDAQIAELYIVLQQDRAVAADTADKERRERLQQIVQDGRRKSLLAAKINPDGMSDAQVNERCAELQATMDRQRAEEEQRANQQRRRAHADSLFGRSCCPERHTLNLNKVDTDKNAEWLRVRNLLVDQAKFADGFLVALLGKRGCGKTQLAVSVIHRACEEELAGRYTKAIDLFRDIRRAYIQPGRGEAGVSEVEIIDAWTKYDFLVVDEFHQRGETNAENNAIINLLDRRYDARLCTVLIANQDKEEFAQSAGDSITSRIHETGEAIVCDWPSYRKPGAWKQRDISSAPGRVPLSRRLNRPSPTTYAM